MFSKIYGESLGNMEKKHNRFFDGYSFINFKFAKDEENNGMNRWGLVLSIVSIGGIYIGILIQRPVASLCNSTDCPFCYGTNLCKDIEEAKITLQYESFSDLFYNLFSVKNVYFAEYEGTKVVLKKLGHGDELNRITRTSPVSEDAIVELIEARGANNLKSCERRASVTFLDRTGDIFSLEQIWTMLQINVEPLILSIFRNGDFPVPEMYGACGLLIVEKHCGLPLNHFRTSSWHNRAFLALQLLEAAVNFTRKHDDFRVYLTDISPDNIAVDDDFNLYFVDLESVILKQKLADEGALHHSEHFDEDDFVYSEDQICKSSVSDHNVYGVCRLLLSKKAPWPMMQDGLLHSPPARTIVNHNELFSLIEECVNSKEKLSRFYIAEELIRLLKQVLTEVD